MKLNKQIFFLFLIFQNLFTPSFSTTISLKLKGIFRVPREPNNSVTDPRASIMVDIPQPTSPGTISEDPTRDADPNTQELQPLNTSYSMSHADLQHTQDKNFREFSVIFQIFSDKCTIRQLKDKFGFLFGEATNKIYIDGNENVSIELGSEAEASQINNLETFIEGLHKYSPEELKKSINAINWYAKSMEFLPKQFSKFTVEQEKQLAKGVPANRLEVTQLKGHKRAKSNNSILEKQPSESKSPREKQKSPLKKIFSASKLIKQKQATPENVPRYVEKTILVITGEGWLNIPDEEAPYLVNNLVKVEFSIRREYCNKSSADEMKEKLDTYANLVNEIYKNPTNDSTESVEKK
jgi:hypothetical protein